MKVLEFDRFELLRMCIRQRSHRRLEYHRQKCGAGGLIPAGGEHHRLRNRTEPVNDDDLQLEQVRDCTQTVRWTTVAIG